MSFFTTISAKIALLAEFGNFIIPVFKKENIQLHHKKEFYAKTKVKQQITVKVLGVTTT